VFLAVLGIIGITLLLIVGRTKEIGIRKVLGASIASILKISVKEYIGFIAIATFIAWPVAFLIIKSWLANFAYRISIDQWVFGGIALLILIGTVLIVGAVSLKAALSNPVKSLRTE
jgi:putative ABC transport system permease protein